MCLLQQLMHLPGVGELQFREVLFDAVELAEQSAAGSHQVFELQEHRMEYWCGFELLCILAGIAAKALTVHLIILASCNTKAVLDVGGITDVQGQSMTAAVLPDQ